MKRAPLNALQQVKEAAGVESVPSPAAKAAPSKQQQVSVKTGSREGKTNITGYFDMSWKNALRLVQIKTNKNFQALLEEALTDLFRKHNVPVPDKPED